jgi:hypothetical protein
MECGWDVDGMWMGCGWDVDGRRLHHKHRGALEMACLRRLIQLDPGVRDGRVSHPQPISWHETKLPPHRGWTIADIVLLIGFGDPEGLQQLNISHLSAM